MAKTINKLPAFIGFDTSMSTVVDTGSDYVVGIIMPDTWTGNHVSVQVSMEGVEYHDLFAVDLENKTSATETVFNVTPGVVVPVNSNTLLMARYIKLRSGTRSEPVNQAATCMFTVLTVGTVGASPLMGVTDGSEAIPGEIGEYMVQSNTAGVQLPSTVPTQVCALSLSPGDWELWGAVDFQPAAGVSPNMVASSISVHPDALPTDDDLMTGVGILNMITTNALSTGQRQMLMTGQCRSNSAEPLDLYLVGQTTLGSQTAVLTAKGYICARRVR